MSPEISTNPTQSEFIIDSKVFLYATLIAYSGVFGNMPPSKIVLGLKNSPTIDLFLRTLSMIYPAVLSILKIDVG
jgi:hypothetical protein